ncbi:hypothetical protein FDECE_7667 [Fusarium decemcellulare]|nr:hypothetical protein FDECE_7667 [Fusarium decemcellulare]
MGLAREECVANLQERLAKVEQRLDKPDHTPDSKQTSLSPPGSSDPKIHGHGLTGGLAGLYEGSSSFINQVVQASELAQRTATSETPEAAHKISESFSHLDALLHPASRPSQLKEHQFSASGIARPTPPFEPLPVSVILAILQRLKAHSAILLAGYAITNLSLIESLCQKVYFPTEPVSVGHVTCVNGILYMVFRELEVLEIPLLKDFNSAELIAQAERNFNLGIETFDVLAVPSFENVLALAIAVIKAQSEAKPMLCHTLAAAAASHCQMLGYHREITYQRDQSGYAECKRRLFWTLYVFDKNASLIFGHASKVQDFEVDTQYPALSSEPGQRPWDMWFRLAIRLAKVQGQTYDRLYSAAGLQATPAERKQHLDLLTADMYKWRDDLERLDMSRANYPQVFALSKIHWDLMYYSTLTSLLRAPVTPGMGGEISTQCFQAARLSLHNHLLCFTGYHTSKLFTEADFANWVLHNSSFTPFVVIFLHAIAASSLEDVELLDQVVDTIKCARGGNTGTEKLFQICSTFARLARRMVEARNSCVGRYDQNTDSLRLAGTSEDVPPAWPEAFTSPPGQHFEAEGFSSWGNTDMSSILVDWINGQPPPTDMFGLEFGLTINTECISAANSLRSSRGPNKPKFIIFKVSDDEQTVVVDETSSDKDYETFREKLTSAVDKTGKPAPRYAVYDVDYDLGEDGKRTKTIFISWVPLSTPIKLRMIYASTMEDLKNALNLGVFIHADGPGDIEWEDVLDAASGGKAKA